MNKIIEGENNMELKVDNKIISYMKIDDEDYISITDMLKSKDGNFFVTDWLRNRNKDKFLERISWVTNDIEVKNLWSQNATANISNKSRSNPRVFTEQGVYMLATILKFKRCR